MQSFPANTNGWLEPVMSHRSMPVGASAQQQADFGSVFPANMPLPGLGLIQGQLNANPFMHQSILTQLMLQKQSMLPGQQPQGQPAASMGGQGLAGSLPQIGGGSNLQLLNWLLHFAGWNPPSSQQQTREDDTTDRQ